MPAKCLSPRRETNIFCPFDLFFGHIINILLTELQLGRVVRTKLRLLSTLPRSLLHTSLRSVFTGDLGQDSPKQTSRSVNKN